MHREVRKTVLSGAKFIVILSECKGSKRKEYMAEVVKNRPQELTKAELEIMQVIWQKGKVLVHDILAELPEPKPAYNTVSTIMRILENKGFVSHKAYAGHTSTSLSSQRKTIPTPTCVPSSTISSRVRSAVWSTSFLLRSRFLWKRLTRL